MLQNIEKVGYAMLIGIYYELLQLCIVSASLGLMLASIQDRRGIAVMQCSYDVKGDFQMFIVDFIHTWGFLWETWLGWVPHNVLQPVSILSFFTSMVFLWYR